MAKSKKKRNNQTQKKAALQGKDFPSGIQVALSSGRSRKALGLVKEARKAGVDLDEKIIGDTYLLRLEDMISQGQGKEAQQFYEVNLSAMPYWNEKVDPGIKYALRLQLGLTEGWDEYGLDAEKDSFMDQIVLSVVKDPRIFAEHTSLPEDHPLKVQAQQVVRAWELIDEGLYSDGVAHLGKIGRRSPFRAWRIFLQSLIAYYGNDTQSFEANLARMPANAVVLSLAHRLQKLLHFEKMDDAGESPVSKYLAEQNSDSELIALETLLTKERFKDAKRKLNDIAGKLKKNGQTLLACEIASLVDEHFDDYPSSLAQQMYLIDLRVFVQERDIEESRWELEDIYCSLQNRTIKGLNNIDTAVLLTRIAEIWRLIYKNMGAEFFDCGEEETWEPGETMRLTELCPGCVVHFAHEICQKALRYSPMEKTYRLNVEILEFDHQLKGVYPVLQSWLKEYPKSITALEKSVPLFIKLEKWKDAEKSLTRLEEYSGRSLALEDFRFDLAAAQGVALCNAGGIVYDDMTKLWRALPEPSGWKQVLVHILKWLSCGTERKLKQEQGKNLTSLNEPYKIFHFCRKIRPKFRKNQLPKSIQKQLEDGAEAFVADLETLLAVPDPAWNCHLNFDELVALAKASGVVPEIEATPTLLCRFLLAHLNLRGLTLRVPENTYALTAKYLSEGEKHLSEFWGLRGLLYCHEFRNQGYPRPWPAVVDDCLMIALHYGLDNSLIRNKFTELDIQISEVEKRVSSLTQKKILQISKREGKRTKKKDLSQAVRPKGRRVAERPDGFSLEDEYFSFDPSVEEFIQICKEMNIPVPKNVSEIEIKKVQKHLENFMGVGPSSLPTDALLELTMEMMISGGEPSFEVLLGAIIRDVMRGGGKKGKKGGKKKNPWDQISFPFDL